ncbi:hypothetical protein ABPG77_009750 [Micractinium sp. CCAP 211/92]
MLLLEPGACEAIDPDALQARADHHARREEASAETLDRLAEFFHDPTTRAILALPEADLCSLLVNDAYKARMHRLYARYMPGVVTDFELSVRRTPVPLAQIREEDPELWRRFQRACSERLGVPPYPPAVVHTLEACFPHFRCSEGMLARAERYGVAPLTWQELDGQLVAFSHGPVEASSHVETTLTQLVQEVTVAAQVRRLQRQRGIQLTPTELLASSLAKLALGVESLTAEARAQAQAATLLTAPGQPAEEPPALMLFAGRRSTSRRFLLLQNWYCMQYLPHYGGTSAPLLRLVGTLAHEVMMVCDQLLGCFDELSSTAGSIAECPGLAQVCALLAHLLLLAAGGGVQAATALSDTFGTRGFVSAALAARIPPEFRQDMQQQYPDQWAALPEAVTAEGARVFDLFTWWRIDSGSYDELAGYVIDAWQARWEGHPPAARPPRPRLMHSNLESVDEIIDMWRLPARIRPAAFAFGTLADGFLAFDAPPAGGSAGSAGGSAAGAAGGAPAAGEADGGRVSIQLASVVMKAVQNRHAHRGLACSTESAGKLGDDAAASKAQFDRRLPPAAVERTRQRMLLLSREQPALDSAAVSAALAAAYHAVTREGMLC